MDTPADTDTTEPVAGIIETLRPMFQRDGGDIALVSVEGSTVLVRLSGVCAGCMMAGQTLGAVQAEVSARLGRPMRVLPAPPPRPQAAP